MSGSAEQMVASGTDTMAIRDLVREAVAERRRLRIVGRGGWLDAGRPVREGEGALRLDVGALSGIVEYVPGDLTLTARAGTSLAEIAAATRAEGQWLALAPWGGDDGSLGATIATATAGPFAHALGLPRDTALGVEVVTGAGEIVCGGGRVVKNVAGFDLVRLMVGAWGTLGVITEVTVRLRALPDRDVTLAVPLPGGAADGVVLERLSAPAMHPIACEVLDAGMSRLVGLRGACALVRVAGNEEFVRDQSATLSSLGDVVPVDGDVWERLRGAEPPGATTFRLSRRPSAVAELWRAATAATSAGGGAVHLGARRGVARCILPAGADAARALAAAHFDGAVRFERMPAGSWASLSTCAFADRLSRGIRRAFDPHMLLNHGILGEEADA